MPFFKKLKHQDLWAKFFQIAAISMFCSGFHLD